MSAGGHPGGAQQFSYGQQTPSGQQLPYGQQSAQYVSSSHHDQQQQQQFTQAHQPQGQQFQMAPSQQHQPPSASHFAHLGHLPMYLLSDPKAAARALHEAQQSAIYRQELLGMMTPEPQLSATDKATLMVLKVTTGAELVSMDRMVNNVLKVSYALETLQDISNRESEHFTLTRWALPREAGMDLLVVDVLEHRSTTATWARGKHCVKASRPVELKVRGKWTAKLNKGKGLQTGWTKSFNKKPVDSMALVVGGKDVPLELVIQVQRAVVGLEMTPIYNGFYKEWVVPS